jgi:hypothetical protein
MHARGSSFAHALTRQLPENCSAIPWTRKEACEYICPYVPRLRAMFPAFMLRRHYLSTCQAMLLYHELPSAMARYGRWRFFGHPPSGRFFGHPPSKFDRRLFGHPPTSRLLYWWRFFGHPPTNSTIGSLDTHQLIRPAALWTPTN